MSRLVYNEGLELFRYIYGHFGNAYFSDLQRLAFFAANVEKKRLTSRFEKLQPGFRSVRDPEIAHELKDGRQEFMQRTANAALREYGDKMAIPRCAKCSAVLRTPRARQCVWCGHSWFHAA
jgi:hypothetical protein